jgi:hypothetical protein
MEESDSDVTDLRSLAWERIVWFTYYVVGRRTTLETGKITGSRPDYVSDFFNLSSNSTKPSGLLSL